MRYQVLFENFIEAVKNEIPKNEKLSAVLADILQIEKEAVYRRLRMDVPFSFTEIAKVSRHLNISLDNIIGSLPDKSRPMSVQLVEYGDPQEVDYKMLDDYIVLLDQVRGMQHSQFMTSCNAIPQCFYNKYENITRFHLFEWRYLNGNPKTVCPFGEVTIPERLRTLQLDHLNAIRSVNDSSFIWEKLIFHYLIEDIRHFESIRLITPQEKQILKKELLELLDELELIASKGYYPDTGKKTHFFVSNINFETGYTILEGSSYHLSMVPIFMLNGMATQDVETYGKVKTWLHSLRRVSTLISESGEKQRVYFFEKQRQIVDSL